ncbi:hypothetical protein BJX63DRAFT_444413 [Aspergillus granulosus]|uniref:Uncharacterized protein n=1 Tax=Aspergillus granulosus TaxID=176169 RepID=A0ABR4H6A6_9EURO
MSVFFPLLAGDPDPRIIHQDTTPLALDEPTRTLYNRAISNPSSLTDQERRLITHRPPQEEENTLCRNVCGLSMDELVAKAINSNSNNNNNDDDDGPRTSHSLSLTLPLSHEEARLLSAGVIRVVQNQGFKILSEVARLSPEDRDLKGRAMQAATTDDIRVANQVAWRVLGQWRRAQDAATETLNADDIRNIKVASKVPWQEHALQSSSTSAEVGGRFGLVVFYREKENEEAGGESRLPSYKSQIGTAIYHSLHYSPLLVKDETRTRFALHWVAVPSLTTSASGGDNINNDDMDPTALRRRFSTMLSNNNNEIPVGYRRDAFLYLDEEAFGSRETARPFLWLAEPESEHQSSTETEPGPGTADFQPLKVSIKHIAPTLFARLVQRDLQGEARRKPYRHTSELSRLHAATALDVRYGGDGIWPPPSRLQ